MSFGICLRLLFQHRLNPRDFFLAMWRPALVHFDIPLQNLAPRLEIIDVGRHVVIQQIQPPAKFTEILFVNRWSAVMRWSPSTHTNSPSKSTIQPG